MDIDFEMKKCRDIKIEEFVNLVAGNKVNLDILDPQLCIAREGIFQTFYAPFEHINTEARVTVVGLTPGQTQMQIALKETRLALANGASWHHAIERAKYSASFGGPMRANLVKMLDHIELNVWLQIDSCASLFSEHKSMAHHTSVLRYHEFKGSQNYSGQPAIERVPFLKSQVDRWFAKELDQLPHSVFIPLGGEVQNIFKQLVQDQKISNDRSLFGIPHPSGANAERISYFLGRKSKADLSKQTNGDSIDCIREKLIVKVRSLRR
jgi:hypothetical protein